jgi:hypothetical protein
VKVEGAAKDQRERGRERVKVEGAARVGVRGEKMRREDKIV